MPPSTTILASMQLSSPLSLSPYAAALLSYRAVWFQVQVQGNTLGNWPNLNYSTNYWVAVSPGSPMTFTSPLKYNGIVWAGIDLTRDPRPGHVANDNTGGNLFTSRELNSQRFASDTAFGANTTTGVSFVRNTLNWGAVSPPRYTNWVASNTDIRYGLQVQDRMLLA